MQRALGVQWYRCVESEQFKFHITLCTKPLTKRGLAYYPWSHLCMILLDLSHHLYYQQRKFYTEHLDWDDELPDKYQAKSASWLKDLSEIEQSSSFGKVVSTEVHIFSDESFYGYRAAAYLQQKDENGNRIVHSYLENLICLPVAISSNDIISAYGRYVIEGARPEPGAAEVR